ncbi:MAG: DNA primase [Anaerolineales bacterium]|nr:DNA primase [Anaerolineales bacterium]
MSVIDEIKARIDIVDLVSETVQLRHSGKNYTGFCPFHSNTRTPAFAVFPDSGTWRCFGQCNEGGDIFGFMMKRESCDFSEALRILADKAGVQLKPVTVEEQVAAEENEHLRTLLEEAVTYYRHHLLNSVEGEQALEYLKERGLDDATLEAFGIGYAPQGWEVFLSNFKSKGYTDIDLLDAGMVSERESGGLHDRFRHRIMFPIRDERGRMSGFGARIRDPEDVPKFLNSPQTVLFDKGKLLYGLDRARKAIREMDQVIIVEGYLDVIALHQAGFTNTVSPMGTALSEHQLNLLKRYTKRIVLALDPDAAGEKATMRGLEVARQALDKETEVVFDARGLLRYEARLQADIRVTTLPDGMDPDEVVKRDPQEWQKILEDAKPVVVHVMETLAASQDIDDPKVKEAIASQVLPLISDLPSAIERETYLQRLARLLRVNERALVLDGRRRISGRRSPRRTRQTAPIMEKKPVQAMSGYALEAHALGLLLRQPDLLYKIDRAMLQEGLSRLTISDFQHSDHQTILRLLQESLDQDMVEPLNFVMNNLSLPMMDVADDLLEKTKNLDINDDSVFEDLRRALLILRRSRARQEVDYLGFLMIEAQEKGDIKVTQYRQSMVEHTQVLRYLDHALANYFDQSIQNRL